MKVYLAGTSVSKPDQQPTMQSLFKQGCKLHSFYHTVNGFEKHWFDMNTANQVDLFLDSGAFSAWSQGVEINIQEYIDFIKQHQDVIDVYANLDVIGDAKATLRNQRIMEEQGLSPLPIFHYGSPEKYLKKYCKEYNYISLGGMVPVSTPNLVPWLDRVFCEYLTDDQGYPIAKIHGFGLTSLKLMLRYPWYSVDSTSWVATGRMGSIYVPRYRNGQWLYDENSWKVAVSSRSPATKEAGKHINNFPPKQKEVIEHYIHSKGYQLGKSTFKRVDQNHTPQEGERWAEKKAEIKNGKRLLEVIEEEGLCNRYQLRDEINIIYFLDLEQSMPEWPWPFKKKNNFGFCL